MPIVQVPGLGNVSFPDGISEADMTRSVQDALTQKNAPAPLSGSISGAGSIPVPRDLQSDASVMGINTAPRALPSLTGAPSSDQSSLGTGIKDVGRGVAKGVLGTMQTIHNNNAPDTAAGFTGIDTGANNQDQMMGKFLEGGAEAAAPGEELISGARQVIPSATRAAGVLGHVADAAEQAGIHVPLSQAMQPLERVTQLGVRGGTSPKAANDLLTRSQAVSPMTFPEARDYYSNISNLSGDEAGKLNAGMKKAVGALRAGFHGDLLDAAAQAGMGDEYAQAMREYANAMRMRDAGKTILTKVLPTGGVLGAIGYGLNKLRGH